ncbi:MAG: potassium channel family protein [Pseudomonadota bacterium]
MTLVLRLGAVIASGMVFFRLVERWTWVDSYYFTVVTISTVGYGDLAPETTLGKIGTTVLIFAGLGVFAVTIQQLATEHLKERDRNPGLLHRILIRLDRGLRKSGRAPDDAAPPREADQD